MTELSQTMVIELRRTRNKGGVMYLAKQLNGYFFGECGPIELEETIRQRIFLRCGYPAVKRSGAMNGRTEHRRS